MGARGCTWGFWCEISGKSDLSHGAGQFYGLDSSFTLAAFPVYNARAGTWMRRPCMTPICGKASALALSGPTPGLSDQPALDELLGNLYEHVLNGVCCSKIVFEGQEPVDRLYLYTNPAYRTQTGMSDVSGRLASEVHRGNEVEEHELLVKLSRIAQTGESEVFEYFERSTGQWYSMSVYSPVPAHVVKVFDNITKRKRLEEERENYKQILEKRVEEQVQDLRESEERYRGLFESLPVGIVVQVPSGEIIDANKAACEILRLSMDQFCGMAGIDESWKPVHEDGSPFPGEEHPALRVLATGEPQLGFIMGLGDADERTWISINCHPLFQKGASRP